MNAHLEWSIKLSLLVYVTSAPGGRLEPRGITSADGRFHFPAEAGGDTQNGWSFRGSLGLFAHYGAPITTLADLRLRPCDAAHWVLEVSPDDEPRVAAFTTAAPRAGEKFWEFDDVTLTAIGSDMFGGYYPEGTGFDPFRVVAD